MILQKQFDENRNVGQGSRIQSRLDVSQTCVINILIAQESNAISIPEAKIRRPTDL